MNHEPTLAALQQWMQQVITHPAGVAAGIDAASHDHASSVGKANVAEIILPSRQCSSVERLAVYSNAYLLRLLECLQAEFPALTTILGEESFRQLAVEYLHSQPSTSYTLGELGRGFPQFLSTTRPHREDPTGPPDWADFLVDVATLERTYSEVFDGPGDEESPPLDPASIAAVSVQDADAVKLTPAASLRLLRLRFPAHRTVKEVRDQRQAVIPPPSPTPLAVYRRDLVVRRVEITTEQYLLLAALQRGESLASALADAFADGAHDLDAIAMQLRNWFRDWTRDRLLVRWRLGD
jgi:hypothetical protein